MLELLAQGERPVVELAGVAGLNVTTASAHLQGLRNAGLVSSRRDGRRILYRLSGPDVAALVAQLCAVAEAHRPDVRAELDAALPTDDIRLMDRAELLAASDAGEVVVARRPPRRRVRRRPPARRHLDPARRAGCTDLARSLPTSRSSPTAAAATACCPIAPSALLTEHGYDARLAADGILEWYGDGVPTATAEMTPATSRRTTAARYWDDRYEHIGDVQRLVAPGPPGHLARADRFAPASSRPRRSSTSAAATPGSSTSSSPAASGRHRARRVRRTRSDLARRRLDDPGVVTWLHADILTWRPHAPVGSVARPGRLPLPHGPGRSSDVSRQPGASPAIRRLLRHRDVRTDGPDQCSGLPVRRYDRTALGDKILAAIPSAAVCAWRDETHVTPSGATQPFTWIAGTVPD